MTAPKSQTRTKEPNPPIILSEAEATKLRETFRATYISKDGMINHTAFDEKCRNIQNCKTKTICIEERKCKALCHESRRKFNQSNSSKFRRTTLETLCGILFDQSFSEWRKSFELSSSTAKTEDESTVSHNTHSTDNSNLHPSNHGDSPKLSSHGLSTIHTGKKFQDIAEEILTSAKAEVWFFNYSLEGTLSVNPDLYIDALKRGVNIKILFFDPENQNIKAFASTLGCTKEKTFSYCNISLRSVVKLMMDITENLGNSRNITDTQNLGSISVRLTENFPRLGAYIADPESENGKSYFVPSINQSLLEHLPILEFKNISNGAHTFYMKGIKKEWDLSPSIQTYLGKESHQTYLNEYPSLLHDYPVD